jgi:Ser/Thr protein kinase RdoA (MazF antagonist)
VTDDKDLKRLVRRRMAKTGESYTAARAHFRPPEPGSRGRASIDDLRRLHTRHGLERLGAHLESRYGISVTRLSQLDVGVMRFDRDERPSWVARVFPAARTIDDVEGDVAVLRFLEQQGVPAERCAHAEPVSMLEDQVVLVTEHVEGVNGRMDVSGETLHALGDLLGRVHSLDGGAGLARRPAGAWHHISPHGGGVRDDVEALLPHVADAASAAAGDDRELLGYVRDALDRVDGCEGLPSALIHPDPCGANAIVAADGGEPVLVDWTGAGHGPRVVSLGGLLAGCLQPAPGSPPSSDLRLTDAELRRLAAAIAGGCIVISCWSLLFQDVPARDIARTIERQLEMSERAAARVADALHLDDAALTSWFAPPAPEAHPGQAELF